LGLGEKSQKAWNSDGEIKQFLIEPFDAIRRIREFNKKWKAAGPWI